MTPEQESKLNEVFEFIHSLKANTTIPQEVDAAFRARLDPVNFLSSTKTAASETQSVNESGASLYSVAKPMDGFEQRTVGGTVRYYPYYT